MKFVVRWLARSSISSTSNALAWYGECGRTKLERSAPAFTGELKLPLLHVTSGKQHDSKAVFLVGRTTQPECI